MDPCGFIEPVIAIIEPMARSTSRVGYIPSTSSIFEKLEDSRSSTFIFRCSKMLLNSSFFFLFSTLFLPSSSGSLSYFEVREASGMGSSAIVLCCFPELYGFASDILSALVPGPSFSHSIWAVGSPSEVGGRGCNLYGWYLGWFSLQYRLISVKNQTPPISYF